MPTGGGGCIQTLRCVWLLAFLSIHLTYRIAPAAYNFKYEEVRLCD